MPNEIIYVPILKAKTGEFGALRSLGERWRLGIKPCIEIPPVSYDFKNQKPKTTLDEHLASIADGLRRSWGQAPCFLDLGLLSPGHLVEDGSHPVDRLFAMCRQKGVNPIPVSAPHLDDAHQEAIAKRVAIDQAGVCVRIPVGVMLDGNPQQIMRTMLARLRVTDRAKTDIILDARFVMDSHVPAVRDGVAAVLSQLPYIAEWRNLIFAGCGFPENLIDMMPNTVQAFPRAEWKLWKGLLQKAGRVPIFGDYAIQHPVQREIDQRVVGPSASLRYTTKDSWLIFRGRGVRAPNSGGMAQYTKLCKDVVAREEFSGAKFSWGDQYISDCARGVAGTGTMSTWRQVGTSHHITFVSHQVSTVLGSSKRS